jgi:urea transporter/murein DD-endopeptidase MepM/ murein hydrolase activator NlpD
MIPDTNRGKLILFAILNSYSQVFFSTSKILAVFLLVISFFDYGAGIGGLLAVMIANSIAHGLGYNTYLLRSGLYGFNALLTGLGVGLFYQPSVELYILIAVTTITCFFLTIVFQGVLGKYGLPFLSVPFLITIWIVALSSGSLSALNLSERGIFVYNEMYALGGKGFIYFYEFLVTNIRSSFFRIYFNSLAAIFFQTHLLAGIIIAAGLLVYSRITFLLSVYGYAIAFLFYRVAGIEFDSLGYTYIGFNYILTAIALGGYYLVPGRASFGWILVLLPAVVLITIATQQLFLVFRISPYSLPFNAIVLIFLYALKLREQRPRNLIETPVQLGNPEQNLYLYSGNMKRFPAAYPVSDALPFYGEWSISQSHNGEHTHKGEWRHAWDFIITDRQGQQFKKEGNSTEDYYCFGKAVLSPADGTVAEVIENVPDNAIGDINTKENWGNTVVIKHTDFLYSKMSHLKYHSVEVKKGDIVAKGQVLGKCGNSGRSPYPHLHFQFQQNPWIGSPTIDYPIGHYLLKNQEGYTLMSFDFPQKGAVVSNPARNEVLVNALHFIPGRRMDVTVEVESSVKKLKQAAGKSTWVVETDVYNNSCIRSEESGETAYFYNNGDLHFFTNYNGKKFSPLFWFFVNLYKIPLGFQPNSRITDNLPVDLLFGGMLKYVQDFAAPLFLFLRTGFNLTFRETGDLLSPGFVELNVLVDKYYAGREVHLSHARVEITRQGSFIFHIETDEAKIRMICQNSQD